MTETMWALTVLAFAFGVAFGDWTANRRWRGNATDYKRIESGGRLYRTVDVTSWSPEREVVLDQASAERHTEALRDRSRRG